MSQKQKTIALIIVALLVWGYTALEWFNYLGNDGDGGISPNVTQTNYPNDFFQIAEVYEPEYEYNDPFLKSMDATYPVASNQDNISVNSPSNNSVFSNNNKDITKPIKEEKKEELKLEYKGVISSSKQKLALILIGTASHIVKEGDIVNGVFIQTFNEKSISIKRGTSSEVLIKK
jgi:hypothetical protein